MKRRTYILDGHQPVPCENLFRWARWLESADRHVAKTQIGPLWVSTVFLGIDHAAFRGEAPQLFETMIFGGSGDSFCERYANWEEAERGHAAAVEMTRQQLAGRGAAERERKWNGKWNGKGKGK